MLYEVVIDSGETPNKCTIAPLLYRSDFRAFRVRGDRHLGPLASPVLLHHEGECLTTVRESLKEIQGLAAVDCIWNRLNSIIRKIEGSVPTYVRIPEGFETAYPRRSKRGGDPEKGLATIEALFIAAAVLGNWDSTLLSEYYFRGKFLELNRKRFLELGVHQAADQIIELPQAPRTRNSLQRKRDRGKV